MKIKWLFFFYALWVFSIGTTLVQSAPIFPDAQVSIKTAQWGVPSAVIEWEEKHLLEDEGIYSFTGRSPVPFTGLSVGWLATDNNIGAKEFEIAIRTRIGEEPWTEWVRNRGDIGPDDSPSGLFWGFLYIPSDFGIHTDFEVRIRPPIGVSLTFARISVADASVGLKVTGFLEEHIEKHIEEGAVTTTPTAGPPRPSIIPRSDWWGDLPPGELNSPRWPPEYRNITHALIHHTVTANNPPNPAQVVRNIWHDHANIQGWGDIGYNFLIDHFGNIYHGRYNPELDTEDVIAAHALGYNTGSMGVGFIGQFHPPEPSPPAGEPDPRALRSTESLLAWRFYQRGLDPLGQATLVDKFIYRIAGHRDVAATACPGDNLYVRLPEIRINVQNLISPTDPPDLIVEDIWVDPDPPMAGDSNTVRFRIKNQGAGDAVGTFFSYLYFDGDYQGYGTADGLTAGSTKTYYWDMTWPSDCDSHTILVVVDAEGDIEESNEGNNERSESFSAICLLPDLIVQDIWIDPDPPVAGASNTIRYRIKNQGAGDAVGTFYSQLYFDGVPTIFHITDGLTAGSTETYSKDITWPSDCDLHTIRVVTDSEGVIEESNEDNNERSESFSAICLLPDLIVQNPQVTSSGPYYPGSSLRVSCVIKNQGQGTAGSSKVKYYLSPSSTGTDYYLGYDSVGSLNPGGTSSESETVTIPSVTCDRNYYVVFYADADGQVEESDENNNKNNAGTIYVQCPQHAPTVTITDPPTDPYTTDSDTIAISATCSDEDGDLSSVKLYNNANGYQDAKSISGSSQDVTFENVPLVQEENLIEVTVYDSGGRTGTDTVTVIYDPEEPPVADFEGNPTQGCVPLTVQFTDKSTNNPTSWSWTFGDEGTSTEKDPNHTYDNPGKYTVSLTATNQSGSDTETKTDYITVLPKPTADFVANPTSGFAPLTVQFTDNSTDNPTSWQWDFGDEGSSVEQHPSHTYTDPGTYTVSLTATNDCGSDTETKTDYIEVKPKEPDISVYPTSLDFGKVVVDDSVDEILTISNDGKADLEVFNITADKPEFSVSETTFTVPSDSSHEIIVTFTPQAEGEITGNLTIESNDPDEGTLPVPVAGVGVPYVNRALSLNGVNGNYVGIDDDSSLNFGASTDFSIVIWVKGDTMSAPKGMVIKGQSYSLENPGYHLSFRADQSPQFIRLILQGNPGQFLQFDTTFDLDDGNWHLVAITCDRDGYAKSYIDGVYQNQRDISSLGNIDNSDVFNIGAYHSGGQSSWDGLIDEVRIWNTALTQQQIQSTMHLRLTGNEPGLVGYWRLDEEPGTPTAHDSSSFGNDGTLFGDADFVEPGAPIARPTVEPNILVYPTELDFGDVIVGKFDEQTLTVVNTGEQDLHVWDISSDSGDVTATPDSFSLAMGQSQQVFVRYSPQTEGPLFATLQIESNDPDEGIVEVVVIGQGVPYVNRAVSLDGDGDYIEIAHSPSLSIDGDLLTMEAWVQTASFTSDSRMIINKEYTYEMEIGSQSGAGDNHFEFAIQNGDTWFWLNGSNFSLSPSQWYHLAVSYDGSQIRTYVNGLLQQSYMREGDVIPISSAFRIGARSPEHGPAFFDGQIDEVRIWNIARTKEEIRADMNQPIENPELLPNLVGYWNFDESTANDSSLYGNHGTLMGDAEIVPLYGTWPPVLRGDVSGDGTISAYDAALILQYTVGLRDSFPADMLASPDGISPTDYILSLPELTANAGTRIQTPIFINDATGLTAGGITLKYDPIILKAVNVTSQTLFLNGAYNKANVDRQGEVRFAFATTQPMKGHGNLFTVEFDVVPNTTGEISPLFLDNVELSNSLSITKLDGSVTVLPSKSALLQNFPNPFNPETWIPYELAKEAEVVIKIYNVKGELVRALSIGHQPAGCYLSKEKAVFWNGKNQSGDAVANGLYFYTLKAGDFQATRKMILVK